MKVYHYPTTNFTKLLGTQQIGMAGAVHKANKAHEKHASVHKHQKVFENKHQPKSY
jgi:hypothetical protein